MIAAVFAAVAAFAAPPASPGRAAAPAPVAEPSPATVGVAPAVPAAPVAPARVAPLAVRMAPATPGSVRFTVTLPAAAVSHAGGSEGGATAAIDGFDPFGEPGAPPLLRRVVTVAVPPLGDVRVNAAASDLVANDEVSLEPMPVEDRGGVTHAVPRGRAYESAGSASPVGAHLLEVAWVRNQRVARIAIEPLAYEPTAHRLTSARRIDVAVQVQPIGALGEAFEPADPFEELYRATLLNYAQGRAWRRPQPAVLAAEAKRLGVSVDASAATALPETSIVLAGHSWVKLTVRSAGLYSVNFSALRNTSLFGNTAKPWRKLRLFTLAGYPLLPEATYCDSCNLQEVAIGVQEAAGADSLMDSNPDAFYFYAQGPSGWASDFAPGYADTMYLNHPYETKNYYYLTVAPDLGDPSEAPVAGDPKRIAMRTNLAPVGAGTVVATFPDRVHFEVDTPSEYWPDASPGTSSLVWEKFFWKSITVSDSSFTDAFDLLDADTTQAARFRLRQWGVTDNKAYVNASRCWWHPDHNLDVWLNNTQFPRRTWDGYAYDKVQLRQAAITIDSTGTSSGGTVFLRHVNNVVKVRVPPDLVYTDCPSRVDRSALAWYEIYYQHELVPRADTLVFRSPGAAGPYHFDIGPFVRKTPPLLYDITDPLAPVLLKVLPAMWDTTTKRLVFEDTASVVHRYRIVPDSVVSVARMASADVADAPSTSLTDNLRSRANGADYVVIYYDAFAQAAELLAAARRLRLPVADHGAPYIAKAVPVSALYDQFSGGRTDPAAIRNFLRAAFYNWRVRPKFVVLLGDASFDFKNLTGQAGSGQPGSLVPTYERGFDNNDYILRSFATDDWLLNVTSTTSYIPDFFGGRLPVDDAATAVSVVQKLLGYETGAPLGEYRNSMVLMADDDMQGANCDRLNWAHLIQTDDMNRNHIPGHVDREYVYLHTYASAGPTKPGARTALRADLNDGVLLFNYIGHGSPFKITDESVFLDTDAGTLANAGKLFGFIAASCDVGKFDDPAVPSLGENLVLAPKGGAIAVISATEQALSGLNVMLANYIYDRLFDRTTIIAGSDTLVGVGQYHVPFSAALLAAKIGASGPTTTNNRKFQLMGDPATLLNAPHWYAAVGLTDVNGAPLTQVTAGQTVVFHGQVLDKPGGSIVPCNGTVSVLAEDSAPTNSTLGNGWDDRIDLCFGAISPATYLFAAAPMYHGNVTVKDGSFEGRFIVPMDATAGLLGRIRAYSTAVDAVDHLTVDGVGSMPLAVATGTAPVGDVTGPRITLGFTGGTRAVRPDATLHIDLYDDSGIMTTGHAQQNAIIVTIDDNTTSREDVTASFRYAADSYQQGTASFTLPSLAAGHHRITVSAADNLASGIAASQHRNSATVEFDVIDRSSVSLDRAWLFPNPVRSGGTGSGGTFIVEAQGDSLNMMIRIYTISGRVIRTLKSFGRIGQVQIPWDGLDAEGEPLANGTYLFKVYANVRDADGTSSPREEDRVTGRFVVLKR